MTVLTVHHCWKRDCAMIFRDIVRPAASVMKMIYVTMLAMGVVVFCLPSTASATIVNLGSDLGFTDDSGGSDPAPVPGQHTNFIGPVPELTWGPVLAT